MIQAQLGDLETSKELTGPFTYITSELTGFEIVITKLIRQSSKYIHMYLYSRHSYRPLLSVLYIIILFLKH